MSYDAKTERLISIKKLSGKAQTSNDKGLTNEGLPSGITMASSTVFGDEVSSNPSNASLYTITGKVEYIRFPASFIAGSDTSDGRHGFELKLPSDYESNSSNSKAGTYPFQNNQVVNITSGSLQLVSPPFSTTYEAKPFYGGTAAKDSGTQIPVLDARDWYIDYFNGIFFQQDPSGTGDQSDNPDFVEAFLYIGDMLDTVVATQTQSKKYVYFLTSSHNENVPLDIPVVDFTALNNDPDKADIFVNGQLMTSGSSNDYALTARTGSVSFNFGLFSGDIVSVRTY